MAIYQGLVQRLRVVPEVTFGTEVTNINSFYDLPILENSVKLKLPFEIVDPGYAVQRLDDVPVGVFGPKFGTAIEFKTNIEIPSTKATNGVAPTRSWLVVLLESMCGGTFAASTGTTISGTGSTTTVINVTDASTYKHGGHLALVNAAGQLEIREIKSKSGNAITVKMAFSFAPTTAGVTVYGAYSCHLNGNPAGETPAYVQFLAEGYNPNHRYLLKGGRAYISAMSGFEPGGKPEITWQAPCCTWKYANGQAGTHGTATLDVTGDELGIASLINHNTVLVADADYRMGVRDVTTLPSFLDANKFNIEPNLEYAPIRTPGGIDTVAGYYRVRKAPCFRGSFQAPYVDNAIDDAHELQASLRIMAQVGTVPTVGGFLLSFPRIEITDKPEHTEEGGIANRMTAWRAGEDLETSLSGLSTSADIARARAAMRIALV